MSKKKIGVAIILFVISLFIGVRSFTGLLTDLDEGFFIMVISRFPRTMAVFLSGVSMSIAGLLMQQLSKNKYLSPSTGATLSSAQLGMAIGMLLLPGVRGEIKLLITFGFAFLGTTLFIMLINKLKFKSIIFVPLIGIILGNIIESLTEFLSYKYDGVQNVSDWMMGDFSLILKGDYELLYIAIVLVILAFFYGNHFNIIGMGEDFSKNLGINYKLFLYMGLFIGAALTATVVVIAGGIPFIGLIIPNIIALKKGDKIKLTIFDTGLLGGIFLLGCDIFSRIIIYPYELPIGVTVGVTGSLMFLILLYKKEYRNG